MINSVSRQKFVYETTNKLAKKLTLSAFGVVGPFAPSPINFALILSALPLWICFSFAAGIRISHSSKRREPFVYGFACGKPTIVPFAYR